MALPVGLCVLVCIVYSVCERKQGGESRDFASHHDALIFVFPRQTVFMDIYTQVFAYAIPKKRYVFVDLHMLVHL